MSGYVNFVQLEMSIWNFPFPFIAERNKPKPPPLTGPLSDAELAGHVGLIQNEDPETTKPMQELGEWQKMAPNFTKRKGRSPSWKSTHQYKSKPGLHLAASGSILETIDPERREAKELLSLVPFKGKEVLEVGCGDGRTTYWYADLARRVIGVDPSSKAIAEAKKKLPRRLASKVRFRVGGGQALPFADESFDIVFFSFSLCCTDASHMGRATLGAWRVLRPGGLLVCTMGSTYQPLPCGMATYLMKRGDGQPDTTEPERNARFTLQHATYVERLFDFVAEKEFPLNYYYDTIGGAIRSTAKSAGVKYGELSRETKESLAGLMKSLKTRKGVNFWGYAVLTVLKKR